MNIHNWISQILSSILSRVHLVRKRDVCVCTVKHIQSSGGLHHINDELMACVRLLERLDNDGALLHYPEAKTLLEKVRCIPSDNKSEE